MYTPVFELSGFGQMPLNRRLNSLRAFLEALCWHNCEYLEVFPNTPKIYEAVPTYVIKKRPLGLDAWYDIPTVLAKKQGDCKDFVCWRVAELRRQGVPDVAPFIKHWTWKDYQIYHVIVRKGAEFEDPSKMFGMPKNVNYNQFKQMIQGT